ncbi:hypothetical protein Lesp02_78850 [Lentzea sp. NBRC 105346]|uniref:SDR family oxidoreductase n=1 Tax=Lentzea sp. NBRC 105346 TaxID=3032205 RepID=UPI0024A00FBA|nr:SDR family NAD(P)-dependent oxidoreductase [Lentzea sp. NBRC 105346]GLZ35698.1 hypothetical protein Lesp02_78850 [Lentzea sp. NBRC 105346]
MRGLTVAVTGAGRGFGKAVAGHLTEAGATVLALGRDELDLTRPATVDRALSGRIDVLVNNAAVPGPAGPAWEVGEADWWETMEVNLRGTVLACRAVLPGMLARGSGRVINIVSSAGRDRWPYASAYSVSKSAVTKYTENLAEELRNRGVSAFAYHPGLLDTGMTADRLAMPSDDPWHNQIRIWLRLQRNAGRFTPLHRALDNLLLLANGTADALTGGYLTADDDIDVLVKEKS